MIVVSALYDIFAGLLLISGCQKPFLSWLYLLGGWGILTMTFTCVFVYIAYHFILIQHNPFRVKVDLEGWWFEHSVS